MDDSHRARRHVGTPVIAGLSDVFPIANVEAGMASAGTPIDVELLQHELGEGIEQVRNELRVPRRLHG